MRNRILACVAALAFVCFSSAGAPTAAQQRPARVRVMTWNLFGGQAKPCNATLANVDAWAFIIGSQNPDVVALQEVYRNQVNRIVERLGGNYKIRFMRAMTCPSGIVYGNAILTRLGAEPEGRPNLSGFYLTDEPSALRRGEKIVVASASVYAANGRSLRIYSAHPPGENAGQTLVDWLRSSGQFKDLRDEIFLTEARAIGQPRTILMGDFNMNPTRDPAGCIGPKTGYWRLYENLVHSPYQPLVDAWKERHSDPNDGPCGYTVGKPVARRRYDYIFYRRGPQLNLVNTNLLEAPGLLQFSDHLPIVADFNVL